MPESLPFDTEISSTPFLSTLPTESRVPLAPYLLTLERLSSHSYNKDAARTSNSRANHYLKFCSDHKVKDPFLLHASYSDANKFFAAYTVYLAIGNTIRKTTIKSGTITSYLADAATLVINGRKAHKKVPFDPRIDIATGNQHADIVKVKKEVERWEKMPNRRNPLTKGMLNRLCTSINPYNLFSLYFVLLDWFILGLHLGFRLSEYAQNKGCSDLRKTTKNRDGRPSAFLLEDIEFYGVNRRYLSHDQAIKNPESVDTVDFCWRQQKNGQDGEKKTVYKNKLVPSLCGIRSAIRIVHRAQLLDLSPKHPVCVYTSNGKLNGVKKFVTEKEINNCLQHLAKDEYGITRAEDLGRYTSHSVRVGACVALHAGNHDKTEIQFALRWRSQTFWTYLRNLPTQAHRSMVAIRDFNPMTVDF